MPGGGSIPSQKRTAVGVILGAPYHSIPLIVRSGVGIIDTSRIIRILAVMESLARYLVTEAMRISHHLPAARAGANVYAEVVHVVVIIETCREDRPDVRAFRSVRRDATNRVVAIVMAADLSVRTEKWLC